MKVFSLALVMLVVSAPAYACLGEPMETRTFLKTLPQDAESQPVSAFIKIVLTAPSEDGTERHSQVRVIDAIQGVKKEQIFTVISSTDSCADDYDVTRGEEYYIAGTLDEKKIFHGEWQDLDDPKPVPVSP